MTAIPAVPKIDRAKQMVAWLRKYGFHPYLDAQGALLIADATGMRRDLSRSRYLTIATVFDTLVAGLADDPGLLDEEERTL